MEINNSFEVPLPPRQTWDILMDIERIAPCMPGAELTGVVDADTYNGKVSIRLGPVALAFAGHVKFMERDVANYVARVVAQGRDSKGRGGANAKVVFSIEPAPSGATVLLKSDLTLSGAVAQYGRASGLIQEVAQQLIGEFAERLKAQLEHVDAVQQSAALATSPPAKAAPISGFFLILSVLWKLIRKPFRGA